MNNNLISYLRTVYYFPLQPWFLKIVGYLFLKRKESDKEIIFSNIRKILIVKIDEIGDFVLATPFLRELRRNFPNSKITLIVKKEVFNIAKLCPYVNETYSFDLKMNKLFRAFQQYYRIYKLGKKNLWKENYDLAIIPRWEGDDNYNVFVAYMSATQNIMGYNQRNGTEKLINLKLEKKHLQHEVKQNLDILKSIGCTIENEKIELWLDEENENFGYELLEPYKKLGKIIIAIAPGASKDKKKWPLENFINLINKLSINFKNKMLIVLLGSKDEEYLGKAMTQNINNNVLDFIGNTTLGNALSIIKFSDLFIGNDSGLGHIAAAFEIPLAIINCHPKNGANSFHDSPFRFGPWCKNKIILQPENTLFPCIETCQYNNAHCISQISVEDVFNSILTLYNKITS